MNVTVPSERLGLGYQIMWRHIPENLKLWGTYSYINKTLVHRPCMCVCGTMWRLFRYVEGSGVGPRREGSFRKRANWCSVKSLYLYSGHACLYLPLPFFGVFCYSPSKYRDMPRLDRDFFQFCFRLTIYESSYQISLHNLLSLHWKRRKINPTSLGKKNSASVGPSILISQERTTQLNIATHILRKGTGVYHIPEKILSM
jgi:hypothetical protein